MIFGVDGVSVGICCRCRCPMALPIELYKAAKSSPKIIFYCAYGHEQHFLEGESEETRLRRDRDRLKQEAARLEEERSNAIVRAEKAEKATKRLKRRAAGGSCPCCDKTFADMGRHMKVRHPGFLASSPNNVVPIKKTA